MFINFVQSLNKLEIRWIKTKIALERINEAAQFIIFIINPDTWHN